MTHPLASAQGLVAGAIVGVVLAAVIGDGSHAGMWIALAAAIGLIVGSAVTALRG